MGVRRISGRAWRGGAALALASFILVVLGIEWKGERPSILLISIDTLRADHLGCYGYPRTTSPFIDSVAADGLLFETAMVPLPATDPSHASLLTGLHPMTHGVHTNSMRLAPEVETVAEVLSRHGYHTMGATAVAHLSRDYGFDQGFAAFSDERSRHSRPAVEVNESVDAMLVAHARASPGTPFFLFVHYFDPHTPYDVRSSYRPPEPLPDRPGLTRDDREGIEGYDSEIRMVDTHIRRLTSRIDALGLGGKLVMCIVSDHGEQFGEHGFRGGHADFYGETVRIPIVCRGPGLLGGRVGRLVSSLDLAPSLLAQAGAAFAAPVDGLPDMLQAPDPVRPGRARGLLVLGYPSYTRSLQIVQDPWVFIRNLDHLYRSARVEHLTATSDAALARTGFREVAPARGEGEAVIFQMPEVDFEPHEITAVVRGTGSACAAAASLKLEPRMDYLREPIRFSSALRVAYPVSRFDRTSFVVSPGHCVAGLFFKYSRLTEGPVPSGTVVTSVFEGLRTPRTGSAASEIYDFRKDPGMLQNLIGSPGGRQKAGELDRKLRVMMTGQRRAARRGEDVRDYTAEEREMLRSLGYLQ